MLDETGEPKQSIYRLTWTIKGVETAEQHIQHRARLTTRTFRETVVRTQTAVQSFKMSGIAATLQHRREKAKGIGTNSHAVKYLNQDYEALRSSCLESGRLFEDDSFEALPSSLGYDELGPNSYKVRGITWKRPTVGTTADGDKVQAGCCSYFTRPKNRAQAV